MGSRNSNPKLLEVAPPNFSRKARKGSENAFQPEKIIPLYSKDPDALSANNMIGEAMGCTSPTKSTVLAWCNDGFLLRDGSGLRIKLPGESKQVNNPRNGSLMWKFVTTKEAVERWLNKVGEMMPSAVSGPVEMDTE